MRLERCDRLESAEWRGETAVNTILSVGEIIGAILFWLVAVPLGLWLLTRAILNAWKLAMWLIEFGCELIAAGLCLVWAPIGWMLACGEWVIRRVRRPARVTS